MLRVLLFATLACACACGGAPPRSASAPPSSPESLDAALTPDPRLDLISAQLAQIREWQSDLEPEVLPTCGSESVIHCPNTSELAERVCESSDAVCTYAAELDGHPWADRKCLETRAVCRDVRQTCCRGAYQVF